ncbi:MAG: hypothetical protein ACRDSM_23695 [Pseudonocardiaceae bacterium]
MSQEKSALVPISDEVGRLYDRFTSPSLMPSGSNLHVGYWDNPDSEVPLGEATDRLTDMMTEKLRSGPEVTSSMSVAGSVDLVCG